MAWQKQSEKPLFPDLLWSRPENKSLQGKLLIIGGQSGEFIKVAAAYEHSLKARAGAVKILLPSSLQKIALGIPDVEFAPATKSGGFGQQSLASFLDLSDWADHVLLVGDFGKNSETTILLEKYIAEAPKPTTIAPDVFGSIDTNFWSEFLKPNISAVLEFAHLQNFGSQLKIEPVITSKMPAETLAKCLENITNKTSSNIAGYFNEMTWVASEGKVTATKSRPLQPILLSAFIAVWVMQNPRKNLEAMTTAAYEASIT